MEHYKVILAYDGTLFAGFQRLQSNGDAPQKRTVQGEVESALVRIGWAGKSILSAGRTDAGVHAAGQVIAFDLEWKHSPEDLCQALNAYLPLDISAVSAEVVPSGFNPRYAARSRRYRYHIFCQPRRDPLRERYAWRVWPAVEPRLMAEAAVRLVGIHDFTAFGSPPHPGGQTRRKVWKACWIPWQQGFDEQDLAASGLRFEIVANAFLYHMVRHLVFTQVQIGQGKLALDELSQALDAGILRVRGLAPAQGLALVQVSYQDIMNFGEDDRGQDFRP